VHEVFYLPPSQPPAIFTNGIVNAGSWRPEIAPGSIAALFGARLAFGEQAAFRLPLPTRMNAVEVRINGISVPLFYVGPDQINFFVPETLPAGQAVVTVHNAGSESAAYTLALRAVAPGIFAAVRRGSFLEIYTTGLGASPGDVRVRVGGNPATVVYAGPSGFQGLSQVNVAIPAGTGDNASVVVEIGGAESNAVIAVAGD
jgi:uncharacterized protein (TIGR03437 family)